MPISSASVDGSHNILQQSQLIQQSPHGPMVFLPVIGSFLWTTTTIAGRKIATLPMHVAQVAVAIAGLILIFVYYLATDTRFQTPATAPFFGSVLLSVVAQVAFVISMTSGDPIASLIAAPAYAGFGALFGWLLFGEVLTLEQTIAAILMFSSIVAFSWHERGGANRG